MFCKILLARKYEAKFYVLCCIHKVLKFFFSTHPFFNCFFFLLVMQLIKSQFTFIAVAVVFVSIFITIQVRWHSACHISFACLFLTAIPYWRFWAISIPSNFIRIGTITSWTTVTEWKKKLQMDHLTHLKKMHRCTFFYRLINCSKKKSSDDIFGDTHF